MNENKELNFKPHKHVALGNKIYRDIRGAILDGTLNPGQRIVESVLAAQMQVSRAPIREALSILKQEGLIVVQDRKGAQVISFSPEEVEELCLVRATLETVAFQLAAKRMTKSDIAELENLISQMDIAADKRDKHIFVECDLDFHDRVCKASGVTRLYKVWDTQHALLSFWFSTVAKSYDGDMVGIANDHHRIFDVLLNGSDADIASAVHDHIYVSGSAYKQERANWRQKLPQYFSF